MKRLIVSLVLVVGIVLAGKVMAAPLTAQMCKDKAIAAAKLLETEGPAAFDKIKDPAGEFSFGDGEGYVWVHDADNVVLEHPKKPELVGKALGDLKDANGKNFFVEATDIATEKGAGWVTYVWPKVGKKESSPKASYCVKAVSGDKTYFVCSGVYDVTRDGIKKQFPNDPIAD